MMINEDVFDQLVMAAHSVDKSDGENRCPTCRIEMDLVLADYICNQCGFTVQILTECYAEKEDIIGGTIRIASGSRKGRLYTISGSGSALRRKITFMELLQHQAAYAGNAFPLDVLSAVATKYSEIQAKYFDVHKDKFVHRASIKDELYAGLIKFECMRRGIPRKNKEITTFMRLTSSGFAHGENILRKLYADGIADITVDDDPLVGYLDRYLDALNMVEQRYKSFVIEMVELSERHYLNMKSQISSKVVGCIYILICKLHLPISDHALEAATDNTKKNTFIKFYTLVMDNLCVFVNIFNKYRVPYY